VKRSEMRDVDGRRQARYAARHHSSAPLLDQLPQNSAASTARFGISIERSQRRRVNPRG